MGTHLLQVPSHWAFSLGLKTLWGLFYYFPLTDENTESLLDTTQQETDRC